MVDTLVYVGLQNAVLATVLAVLVGGLAWVCRRPALLHGLWLLVLLKLVTPPLVDVPLPWPSLAGPPPVAAQPPPAAALVAAAAPEGEDLDDAAAGPFELAALLPAAPEPVPPVGEPDAERDVPFTAAGQALPAIAWPVVALAVWLAGAVWWWALAGWRIVRFRRLLRFAEPAPEAIREQGRRLAQGLGLRRCPDIRLVHGCVSPMLWAVEGRPRVLLPLELWQRLREDQREALLAHELARLRRGDHWVRLFELIVLGLFWWHPVAWWACRELREAEEQCCDAWVVWLLPRAARAYATALVETVDFLSGACPPLPRVASGVGHAYLLRRRLTMIMRGTPPRALTRGGLAGLLGMGALLLPLGPSWGQTPPPAEREEERQRIERRERLEREAQRREEVERDRPRERPQGNQERLRAQGERERQRAGEREGAQREDVMARERAAVDELRAHLELMRREMQRAEQRLREAERRLTEMGRGREQLPEGRGDRREGQPPGRGTGGGADAGPGRGPGLGVGGGGGGGSRGGPDMDPRLQNLERRLEEVMRAVEELRRDMRRQPRPGSTPGQPGTPPRPQRPGGRGGDAPPAAEAPELPLPPTPVAAPVPPRPPRPPQGQPPVAPSPDGVAVPVPPPVP